MLPHVSPNLLAGLMEAVAAPPYNGRADLPPLADELHMEIDDLFPVAETLQLLRFAEVAEGDIRLTDAGKAFARGELDARKKLFAQHLLTYVPLAAHISRVLDERASHSAPRAASATSWRTTCPRTPPSRLCAPSSAGGATRKSSLTTTTARHSASKIPLRARRGEDGAHGLTVAPLWEETAHGGTGGLAGAFGTGKEVSRTLRLAGSRTRRGGERVSFFSMENHTPNGEPSRRF